MRITKVPHFFSPLLLVGLLVSLSSCGSAPGRPPGNVPDRVQIEIDRHLPNQEKPVVTLTVGSLVQQLYATVYALPLMPSSVTCTAELGPHYNLTFYQGQKRLVTALAENNGCRRISLSGEQHDRTAMNNKEFWDQLDNAIYEATAPAKVDWLSLMPTAANAEPPQTAQITSANTAQDFYDAILALPLITKNYRSLPLKTFGYADGTTDYQLIFHTTNQTIAATIDLKQKQVALDGEYHSRGGVYRMNEQFTQMFTKTLTEAALTPAQPDALSLRLSTNKDSGSSTRVTDTQLIQQLYTKVFTLPATQPPPENCLSNDKSAGKDKRYELTFLQWDLVILQMSAYEGSCTFVGKNFNRGQSQYLQADQEFWTWLHQAAGQ